MTTPTKQTLLATTMRRPILKQMGLLLITLVLVILNFYIMNQDTLHVPNFLNIKNRETRDQALIRYLLPKIKLVNERLRQENRTIRHWHHQFMQDHKLTKHQYILLNEFYQNHYHLFNPKNKQHWATLLKHYKPVLLNFLLANNTNKIVTMPLFFNLYCYHVSDSHCGYPLFDFSGNTPFKLVKIGSKLSSSDKSYYRLNQQVIQSKIHGRKSHD